MRSPFFNGTLVLVFARGFFFVFFAMVCWSGFVRLGLVIRFGSIRFGSVRFDSIGLDRIRLQWFLLYFYQCMLVSGTPELFLLLQLK